MTYEYGWYVPSDYGLYGMYGADIRLAVSADGANFERVNPHQPTIARGAHTEWDGGLLVITDKPVVKDGTVYLFYGRRGRGLYDLATGELPSGRRLRRFWQRFRASRAHGCRYPARGRLHLPRNAPIGRPRATPRLRPLRQRD